MDTTIWFALGAALGLTAYKATRSSGTQALIEDVLVGIFAAFIGGVFVGPNLLGKPGTVPLVAVALGVTLVALIGLHQFRANMNKERPRRRRRA